MSTLKECRFLKVYIPNDVSLREAIFLAYNRIPETKPKWYRAIIKNVKIVPNFEDNELSDVSFVGWRVSKKEISDILEYFCELEPSPTTARLWSEGYGIQIHYFSQPKPRYYEEMGFKPEERGRHPAVGLYFGGSVNAKELGLYRQIANLFEIDIIGDVEESKKYVISLSRKISMNFNELRPKIVESYNLLEKWGKKPRLMIGSSFLSDDAELYISLTGSLNLYITNPTEERLYIVEKIGELLRAEKLKGRKWKIEYEVPSSKQLELK